MTEIDFTPPWYPRMRKNRQRLVLTAIAAGAVMLITAIVVAACLLLN